MAKRSGNEWNRERVTGVDEVTVIKEEPTVEFELEAEPETVRVMLLKNLKVNYYGKVTRKLYVFSGGGAIVEVDRRDVETMLQKVSGVCNSCPTATTGTTPYFQVVED